MKRWFVLAVILTASSGTAFPAPGDAPPGPGESSPGLAAQPEGPAAALREDVQKNMRSLWLESVSSPSPLEQEPNFNEALNRLRRVRFVPAMPSASAPAPSARPPGPATSLPRSNQVDEALLKKLAALDAKDVDRPEALADLYFAAGQKEAAEPLYQLALRTPDPVHDPDWVLLQLGYCRSATQPALALESFQKLVQEHAKSPYAPAAQISLKLLEWRRQHDPQGLLTELKKLEDDLDRATATPTPMPASQPASQPASRPAR